MRKSPSYSVLKELIAKAALDLSDDRHLPIIKPKVLAMTISANSLIFHKIAPHE